MKTRRQIDDYKDYMFRNRDILGYEKVSEMEKNFIEMVKQYKYNNFNDTKTIRRWRNWYSSVKDELHKKKIPQSEYEILQYHLETFRVKDAEFAVQKLENWINRMKTNGYIITDDISTQINNTIEKYGYTFKG